MTNRVQATIYAQALYNASTDKKGKGLEQLVDNFVSELAARHQVHLIALILEELQSIHFEASDQVATRVTTREKIDSALLTKIKTLVKNNTGMQPEITEEIDQTMLGGVAIKYQDKIIDLTIDNQLKSLSSELTK